MADLFPLKVLLRTLKAATEGPVEYFDVEVVEGIQRAFQRGGDLRGHGLHLN